MRDGSLILKQHNVLKKTAERANISTCANEIRQKFFSACLPIPEVGIVHLDEFHARLPNLHSGDYVVWFITKNSPQSVFFDESSGLFGCCWGPDQDSGEYADLGYRSDDPVEMFSV
jgi:hypothetical protein